MGIRLVSAALNPAWAGLSDRARLVLLQMAWTAKDTSNTGHATGRYWAGHEPLIISVLGLDPDQLDPASRDVADRKLRRAVQELTKAGAITLLSAASRGRTAIYDVHPSRFPLIEHPVDKSRPDEPLPGEWGSPGDLLSEHPMTSINPEWRSPSVRMEVTQ